MKPRDPLVAATARMTGLCLEDPDFKPCGQPHPHHPALVCEHPRGHGGQHHFTSRFWDGRPAKVER